MRELLSLINGFVKNDQGNLNVYGKMAKILVIILITRILVTIINGVVDRTFKNRKNSNEIMTISRANTLGEILKSVIRYTLYFIASMTILDMFINTASILATAGIGGVAIGFGAQSLVKDMITGFFILFEDQYALGDYVKIAGNEGIVEELGVRVTKLRDFSGELHIIPNGNVDIVTNRTRGPMRALVEVEIAYEEDVDHAIRVLEKMCLTIKEANNTILEGPNIIGVTNLAEYGVTLRIVAQTHPMDQWSVEREIRKKIKETLDAENIEIPYPRIVIAGGGKNDIKL